MRTSPLFRGSLLLTFAAFGAALAGCRGDAPTGGAREPTLVPITISAALTPEQAAVIAGMSVEVSGPGIPVSIVGELEVSTAAVVGTVTVPVGGQRRFVVRAHDAAGLESYFGEATATVVPGSNPTVGIILYARSGGVPVEVSVGTISIALSSQTAQLIVGQSATVGAIVTDAGVPVTTGVVRWAAINPVLVGKTVSIDGRVADLSGLVAGETTVVATFNGVAAALSVRVIAP